MHVFDYLSPEMQRAIYELEWRQFRQIQIDAIKAVNSGTSDLIISAPTASGKTEAAFLPIISLSGEEAKDAVKILYISPLRALINDQFKRVQDLCRYLDFPVTMWHGEASVSAKKKVIKKPRGIILMTPESLEAMFVNHHIEMRGLLGQLSFIVIDEIHSFTGNVRGTHLVSLIRRLEYELNIKPRKIALSATVTNPEDLAELLNPENPKSVKIITSTEGTKKRVGKVRLLRSLRFKGKNEELSPDVAYSELDLELHKRTLNGKSLIFGNNKNGLEEHSSTLRAIAKLTGTPNIYGVHHASLSRLDRKKTEEDLKSKDNIAVFCTNTLELGIDIGSIDRVIFLQAPHTVSSLIQRLGRCGRKEGASQEFQFFLPEYPEDKGYIAGVLKLDLVKSIAEIELMKSGWSEPLNTRHFDWSTLVHQILSLLSEHGGMKPKDLYLEICTVCFRQHVYLLSKDGTENERVEPYFSKEDFSKVLNGLYERNLIMQYKTGVLALAPKGEQITEFFDFYAAFDTLPEFSVSSEGKSIGTINPQSGLLLKKGDAFVLGGRRWKVEEIIRKTRHIKVIPTEERKIIDLFCGPSFITVHPKIHSEMRRIFEEAYLPSYLTPYAETALTDAYALYHEVTGKNGTLLPIFMGTRVQAALRYLLQSKEFTEIDDARIGLFSRRGTGYIMEKLKEILPTDFNIEKIFYGKEDSDLYLHKFDEYLPREILLRSFVEETMDLRKAQNLISHISRK